jgi:hypothetical protein
VYICTQIYSHDYDTYMQSTKCTHTHTHIHTHKYKNTNTCIHKYTYIQIGPRTMAHTNTHIHIHTNRQSRQPHTMAHKTLIPKRHTKLTRKQNTYKYTHIYIQTGSKCKLTQWHTQPWFQKDIPSKQNTYKYTHTYTYKQAVKASSHHGTHNPGSKTTSKAHTHTIQTQTQSSHIPISTSQIHVS